MEDFEKSKKLCDDTWHLVPKHQSDKLEELRISKLAAQSLLIAYQMYEKDLKTAEYELYVLENSDTTVAKDYDPE